MDKKDMSRPERSPKKPGRGERPIPPVYPVIDTDLARDNVENDLSAADREKLSPHDR